MSDLATEAPLAIELPATGTPGSTTATLDLTGHPGATTPGREDQPQTSNPTTLGSSYLKVVNDSVSKDDTAKDDTAKDDTAKDDTAKDDTAKDDTAKDDTAKDDTAKDDTAKDDTAKDDTAKDDTAKDDTAKDDTAKDDTAKDDTAKDDTTKKKMRDGKAGFKGVESTEPELTAFMLNKTAEVFVPWPSLEEQWRIDSHQRLIVIVGQPGSGRFTTAVWAGLKLLNDPKSRIVPLTATVQTGIQLLDWVRSSERQRKTVYILQQPLGARFAFPTLDDGALGTAARSLQDLQSWLILTARPEDLRGSSEQIPLLRLKQPDKDQLSLVLDRHLAWIDGNVGDLKLNGDLLDEIKALIRDGTLGTAPQVVMLLVQLPELHRRGGLGSMDERGRRVRKLAEEVTGGMTQDWFARLAAHEKLLALLVEAFRGIHQAEVEEIYIREADRLRLSDPRLPDPRRHSFSDLYRKIAVEISVRLVKNGTSQRESPGRGDDWVEVRHLEFSHESHRGEVLRQIQSRHHLLWEVVKGIEHDLNNRLLPWQAPQRQALGEVIARIGVHRPQDLKLLMEELIMSPDGIVASVPGYILRGICLLDQPDYLLVSRTLRNWVRNGDFDHVWGAVAAIWRVYCELGRQSTTLNASSTSRAAGQQVQQLDQTLKQLEDSLTDAARSTIIDADAHEVAHEGDFLSYAVERMFLELPGPVGALVQRWLKAGGKLKKAGCRAALRLYVINRNAGSLVTARFEALLDLMGAVLRLKRDMVDDVLQIVLEWLEKPEDENSAGAAPPPEGQQQKIQRITQALFSACNRAGEGGRQNLRRSLTSFWLRSHSPNARDIAHAVINRARLLDGVAVEVAGAGRAVLMVDASEAGRHNDTAARMTQQIFEFLSPQVDLWVVQPGSQKALSQPGQKLEAAELSAHDQPLPRIVMPWVEKLTNQSGKVPLHFACIIHWDKLVDGEDLNEAGDVPIFAIAVSGHHLPSLENETRGNPSLLGSFLKQVAGKLNEESSENFLALVGPILGAHLSKILAARSQEHWWETLQEWLPASAANLDDMCGRRREVLVQMETLAAGLDQVPASLHGPDPLKQALGLVQWLAANDLADTVRHLCTWMRSKVRQPTANFAAAAATMLLRMHSSRMLSVATLLHLQPHASRPGSDDGCAPAPPADQFLPLLDLAPALARYHSIQGIQVLLEALRFWAGDPGWATRLPEHPALSAMIDEASPSIRTVIHETFDELASAHIQALGEKQVPAAVLAMHLRLKCGLLLRATPDVELEGAVLILWHDSGQRGPAGRLGRLAWQLFSRVEEERRQSRNRPPGSFIFMRAGTRHPVAVSGEGSHVIEGTFAARLSATGVFFPLLAALGSAVSQVVLMTDGPVMDAEDWLDPEGELSFLINAGRLKLFWDAARIDKAARWPGSANQPEWTDISAADDKTVISLVFRQTASHLSSHDS